MTSKELEEAWILWIKSIQNQSYRDVYIALTEKKKHNLVNQLGLTLDEDRIIRCVIRLGAAQLTEGARAPILLLKKYHVTDLLIDSCHRNHCTLGCHRPFPLFAKYTGFHKDVRKSEEFCGNA